MKKKLFLVIMFLGLLVPSILASESDFKSGIQAYNEGNFKEALNIFEELNKEYDSASLYYNIGNCHLKMGNIGFAISAYYSSLLREPTNPDVKHNLNYVQNLTKDKIFENTDINGLGDVFLNIIRHFSLKFHQILFLLFYFIVIILFFVSHFKSRKYFKYPLIQGTLLCLLLMQGIFLHARTKDYKKKLGVAIAKELIVRYGPSKTETEAFLIHEGTNFEVFNIDNNSAQIKIKDGKSGWVDLDKITLVK